MAPRRKRATTRRRKFRGIRPINTGIDLYQANAVVHAATNTGLWGFFVAPWMRDAVLNPVVDQKLDSRELLALVMGHGMTGGMSRYSAAAFEAGRSPATEGGISSIFLDNLQKNAVPAVFKIVGSNIAKKVITKSGVTRSLNRITRGIGMQDLVRW